MNENIITKISDSLWLYLTCTTIWGPQKFFCHKFLHALTVFASLIWLFDKTRIFGRSLNDCKKPFKYLSDLWLTGTSLTLHNAEPGSVLCTDMLLYKRVQWKKTSPPRSDSLWLELHALPSEDPDFLNFVQSQNLNISMSIISPIEVLGESSPLPGSLVASRLIKEFARSAAMLATASPPPSPGIAPPPPPNTGEESDQTPLRGERPSERTGGDKQSLEMILQTKLIVVELLEVDFWLN